MINKTISTIGLILTASAMSLLAQNGTWNTDASGNWSDTSKWLSGVVADGTGNTADFSTINIAADRTVTLDAAHTLSTLKFGDAGVTDHNWTLSGANTLTLGTTPTINVVNQTATISSLIAGTAFTKLGAGTLVLNGSVVNTFTGTIAVKAGTLTEDFSNLGTPANLVASSVVLSLAGGTLNINGAASGATSQAFASTTFNTGGNAINVVNNGTSATLTLGAITYSGVCPVQYSSTGTITTTTAGGGPLGLMWVNYSTFGTSDWATTDTTGGAVGTSPYTIKGLSSVTGGYQTTLGNNFDMQTSLTISGNSGCTTIRFNTPAANNVNVNGKWFYPNAVLVTPNMGAVNSSISGGSWFAQYNTSAATEWVVQNNTAGYFCNIGGLINDKNGGGALTYVQSGPGTVTNSTVNAYTGQSYLNGGCTMVMDANGLGIKTTGAQVNLNGGTVVGNATFTMDNGGANKRAFVLGTAGGGLAATAGNTMTIDGIVSSATASVGALTIGIPASSANGSTQGLLPGSGSGTANTTSVMATGTVALSGANTYSGGTIIQNAVLNFASGSLGTGGVSIYGGTLQWNANTTDISAQTVTIGTAGATFDVNGNSVSLANSIGNGGSGALTVYSSTGAGSLTLLAGNNYSGGTTVTNGTLVVNNASGSGTGSGAVTLANNGMLGGTGIVGGAVTINSGGIIAPGTTAAGNGTIGTLAVGALTMGSGSVCNFAFNTTPANDTIVVTTSGGLTVNGGVFNLYSAGGTSGWTTPGVHTYYLISYAGSIGGTGLDSTWTNDSPSNPHVANPQSGYSYHFGTNFGYLTVTISQAATLGAWGVNASGNWTVAGNWIGGNVPGVNSGTAGDTATFAGVTTIANYFVNLNANESVGAVTFNQAPSFSITNAANTLTLDNKGVGAVVTVSGGTSNSIQTAVSLNDNTTVTVNSGKSLAISGIISNAPSVTKTLTVNGAGTTILSGANTYGPAAGTVGTTLGGGGTLQVGNAGALGAGDVTNNGNVTLQAGASVSLANNLGIAPAVTVTANNNGNSMALNGVISGSGALTAIGGGILTLGGNNTLTGNLTVNAGTLSISAAVNVASNIVLNGGDLLGSASFYMANNLGIGPTNGATPGTALIDAATGQTFELDGIIASAGNTGANNLVVNSLAASPGTVMLGGATPSPARPSIYTNTLLLDNPLALQDSILNYRPRHAGCSPTSLRRPWAV
jgi:fibronectin-binding autotransporter adhesin